MIKYKLLFITIFILVFIFICCTSFGKCPYREYKITGKVQDKNTNQPIADAKLIFFFDEVQWTGADMYGTKYPDYFITNSQGSFNATAWLNTYSGWFPTDRCNYKPKNLTVIIVADGYTTERIYYKLKKLLSSDGTINLPSILLHKIKLENPTTQ